MHSTSLLEVKKVGVGASKKNYFSRLVSAAVVFDWNF